MIIKPQGLNIIPRIALNAEVWASLLHFMVEGRSNPRRTVTVVLAGERLGTVLFAMAQAFRTMLNARIAWVRE
jgi:hypothetical protein